MNLRPFIFPTVFLMCLSMGRSLAQEAFPIPVAAAARPQFSDSVSFSDKSRKWLVGGGQAALWATTFTLLNKAWYENYPKQPFHFFNDWKEWQQMDKAGHAWTSYVLSRVSGDMWRWSGMNEKKAAWLGGATGLAFVSIIEILDGHSEKWGFSPGDMAFNTIGAGLYTAQSLGWKEQRILLKLSYLPYAYSNDIRERADDLFGASPVSKLLKDYNGQTYWLSLNLKSFLPRSNLPGWLHLAVGYNARLMIGGHENSWTNSQGQTVNRTDIQRYRRFFLSADIDLTKIRTRNKVLQSVFGAFNVLKIPAPALEFNTRGEFRGHLLYY